MYILRIFFGLLLVFSLTLPLSTCSGPIEEGNQAQPDLIERYIISDFGSTSQWLSVLTFIIPLAAAISIRNQKGIIKSESICLLSVIPCSVILYVHTATGTLAAGGIMALVSIMVFFTISLISLVKISILRINNSTST
ncbi:hypothetical protein [Sessilibacter sp. MAH2]